jgi:hypothetical protein
VRPKQANEDANSHNGEPPAARLEGTHMPIWERFIEASREIPDEELDRLPADLATQVDHYLYGTPKRPA